MHGAYNPRNLFIYEACSGGRPDLWPMSWTGKQGGTEARLLWKALNKSLDPRDRYVVLEYGQRAEIESKEHHLGHPTTICTLSPTFTEVVKDPPKKDVSATKVFHVFAAAELVICRSTHRKSTSKIRLRSWYLGISVSRRTLRVADAKYTLFGQKIYVPCYISPFPAVYYCHWYRRLGRPYCSAPCISIGWSIVL